LTSDSGELLHKFQISNSKLQIEKVLPKTVFDYWRKQRFDLWYYRYKFYSFTYFVNL